MRRSCCVNIRVNSKSCWGLRRIRTQASDYREEGRTRDTKEKKGREKKITFVLLVPSQPWPMRSRYRGSTVSFSLCSLWLPRFPKWPHSASCDLFLTSNDLNSRRGESKRAERGVQGLSPSHAEKRSKLSLSLPLLFPSLETPLHSRETRPQFYAWIHSLSGFSSKWVLPSSYSLSLFFL